MRVSLFGFALFKRSNMLVVLYLRVNGAHTQRKKNFKYEGKPLSYWFSTFLNVPSKEHKYLWASGFLESLTFYWWFLKKKILSMFFFIAILVNLNVVCTLLAFITYIYRSKLIIFCLKLSWCKATSGELRPHDHFRRNWMTQYRPQNFQ